MSKYNIQQAITNAIVTNGNGDITATVLASTLEEFLNQSKNEIVLSLTKSGSGVSPIDVGLIYSDFPSTINDSISVSSYGTSVFRIESLYEIFPHARRVVTIEPTSNINTISLKTLMYEDEGVYGDKIDIMLIEFNDTIGQWQNFENPFTLKVKIEIYP